MITVTIQGAEDVIGGMSGMQRQIPYAAANGINTTARRVKGGLYTVMGLVFDRPTPFTLNSLQMTAARAPKGPLTAEVWFKDPPNLGTYDHYLLPQVDGGSRHLKPFEMGLGGHFVVPGKFTPLDQYGNLGRGVITKLLSISGGFRVAGFDANTTSKAKLQQFFRLTTAKNGLFPGIYQRVAKAGENEGRAGRFLLARALVKKGKQKGQLRELTKATKALLPRGAQPLVIFPGKAPNYAKRFDFYGVAESIVNQYGRADMEAAVAAEVERELAYRARHGR